MTNFGIGSLVHVCRTIFPVFKHRNLYDPCIFPVGPMAMAGWVQGTIEFDGSGSLWTSQYVPKGVLQCFSASNLCLHMSSLGLHLLEIPALHENALIHIVTNFTNPIIVLVDVWKALFLGFHSIFLCCFESFSPLLLHAYLLCLCWYLTLWLGP